MGCSCEMFGEDEGVGFEGEDGEVELGGLGAGSGPV